MPISYFTVKLLALAETIHRWLGALSGLDQASRERVADFSDQIAATLARASAALNKVADAPKDRVARADARRELGRIAGYIETLVDVLAGHLDGRKLAGVKKRLETLDAGHLSRAAAGEAPPAEARAVIEQLSAAEGYFRALADGLRA